MERPAPHCAVVGYDGTDEARAALAWALDHVDPDGDVIAVAVLGQEPAPVPGGGAVALLGGRRDARDEERLRQSWAHDAEAFENEVELVVEHGRPSSVLIRIADERDADVLVLGHRRHRMVAPSVLRDLLSATERPVVIVP